MRSQSQSHLARLLELTATAAFQAVHALLCRLLYSSLDQRQVRRSCTSQCITCHMPIHIVPRVPLPKHRFSSCIDIMYSTSPPTPELCFVIWLNHG